MNPESGISQTETEPKQWRIREEVIYPCRYDEDRGVRRRVGDGTDNLKYNETVITKWVGPDGQTVYTQSRGSRPTPDKVAAIEARYVPELEAGGFLRHRGGALLIASTNLGGYTAKKYPTALSQFELAGKFSYGKNSVIGPIGELKEKAHNLRRGATSIAHIVRTRFGRKDLSHTS